MPSTTIPAAYAVYQPLRAVEPPDSPLAGTLARAPDGRIVLLVDRTQVDDWPGWGAAAEPHLLSPIDVVRRSDGHDVVLPALRERLTDFLVRRSDADAPLSSGEAVTLGVSVLRGLVGSLARGEQGPGQWWLADDGRPVLVEGVGEQPTRDCSAEACRLVGERMLRTRLGAALRELADAMQETERLPDAIEWEERLFACAAPEPLTTEVLGPQRARAVAVESIAQESPRVEKSLWNRLALHVDADLADTASDALNGLLRRIRRPGASRRRPVLWAAGIGAVVVVGGLLWPAAADTGETAAPAPAQTVSAHDDAPPEPAADPGTVQQPSAPQPPSDDVTAVAAELLSTRSACADTACLAAALEDPLRELPAGVIDEPADARELTLLDDLGGLVVLRVDSRDGTRAMQLVTVVETERGWRIRDVHDVSDAPS